MKAGKGNSTEQIKRVFDGALGKSCWHVTVGAPTSPEFSLALGDRVKRQKPLQNPRQSEVFRQNEGEVSIFIRCVWRLEQGSFVIVSSNDTVLKVKRGLRRIVDHKFIGFKVEKPAWDLSLEFTGGLRLRIFCEHTEQKSNSRRNWQARVGTSQVFAGPGTRLEIS